MRIVVALAGSVLAAGCSSGTSTAPEAGADTLGANSRVERCTSRFSERAESTSNSDTVATDVIDYVRRTYCVPFDARGWVHDNGALSIDAFTNSGEAECQTAEAGEQAKTVPCESLEPIGVRPVLDCAILHLVRRREVRDYINKLQPRPECDDGTPVELLGVE